MPPENRQSSGNCWIRLYSLTLKTRNFFGWHIMVALPSGTVGNEGRARFHANLLRKPHRPPHESYAAPSAFFCIRRGKSRQLPPEGMKARYFFVEGVNASV